VPACAEVFKKTVRKWAQQFAPSPLLRSSYLNDGATSFPLLAAGRKVCKITQKRPKTGRKQILFEKLVFEGVFLLLSVSLSQQIFKNIYAVNI
jgi:hypothetical protein